MQPTRGFDLKRRHGIKRHDRPNAPISTIEKYPIDLKEFSLEPDDWTTWSKVHWAQLSALGCADALTETASDETEVNRDDFDRGSVDPDRLRKAQQAWVSLVTSCKGRVRYRECGRVSQRGMGQARTALPGQRTLGTSTFTIDFYKMKVEVGEHLRKFLLRVDQPLVDEL